MGNYFMKLLIHSQCSVQRLGVDTGGVREQPGEEAPVAFSEVALVCVLRGAGENS